jgi:hypothetical protein
MKIFINRPRIERRARLANFASIGGLVLLLGSVLLPLFLPRWAKASYVLMIAGIGIAMIGIYFANRWVRKPRPEESLPLALKSFDDRYRLYLYPAMPCDHVLLTPTDLIALETTNLAGQFSLQQGQWKEAMGLGRALRYIVEEPVTNPVRAAPELEQELRSLLAREPGLEAAIPIRTVFVFTHPAANLDIKDSPVSICKVEKLKKHVAPGPARIDPALYERLAAFLEQRTLS